MRQTIFQRPQISLTLSTPGRMWMLCGAAALTVFQSSLGDSFRSLLLAAYVLSGSLLGEFLCTLRGREGKGGSAFSASRFPADGSAAASALVLTLFLPNTLNPLCGFFGAFFAMIVVKHTFGGLGSNWINPAAGGWLFIRASWPGIFDLSLENSTLARLGGLLEGNVKEAAPLFLLKINGWQPFDGALSGFLNNSVLAWFGIRIPEGYLSFLSAPGPGIIADRGLFCLILGTILLAAFRSFRLWIPAFFLFVYLLLVRMFGGFPFGGGFWSGDILFALFSGGTLAAAFILLTDPTTGPKSMPGYFVFIFITAFFSWFFRYPGWEPYGVVPAVLAGNMLVPLIRRLENLRYYEKRRER